MKPECIQAINKSAGKVLSDSELNKLETDIIRHLQDIPSDGLSKAERYRLAGEKAHKSRISETAKLLHDHIDEMYKRQNILNDINTVEAGIHGKSQAFFQKLFHQAGSSEVPLEHKMDKHYKSTIAPLEKHRTSSIFIMDKQYNKDVISELLGEETGNSKASALARTYEQINKDKHREAIEAGIGYNYRKNRVPQVMDSTKLSTTTEVDFVKSMLQLVDRDKYKNPDGTLYSDEKLSSHFRHSFREVLGEESSHINFGSKIGKKRTYEREFHFKDADAHIEFMEKFGIGANVGELLATDIKSLSKDIVIARELGVNADDFVRKTMKKLIAEDAIASAGKDNSFSSKLGISPLQMRERYFNNMWDVMIHGSRPDNEFWANIGAGIRSYTHTLKLGQHAIASAIEDPRISMDMLSRIGIDKAEISRIKKLPLSKRKEMLSDISLFADGVIADGRLMSEGLSDAYRLGHKMSSAMHKASGVKWHDERTISTHALVVYNQIGRQVEKYASLKDLMSDKGLDEGVKLFFKLLDDTDFQVLKKTKTTTGSHGDLSLKSLKDIRNIPDNELEGLVAKLSEEKTKHLDLRIQEIEEQRATRIANETKKLQQNLDNKLSLELQKLSSLEKGVVEKDQKLREVRQTLIKQLEEADKNIKNDSNIQHKNLDKQSKKLANLKLDVKDIEQRITKLKSDKEILPKYIADIKTDQLRKERIKLRSTKIDNEIKHLNKQITDNYKTVKGLEVIIKKGIAIPPTLNRERKLIAQKLANVESAEFRNKTLSGARSKVFEQEKYIKGLKDEFSYAQKGFSSELNSYLAGEQQQLKNRLTEIRSVETSVLKDRVVDKIGALVISNLHTSVKGAMDLTLLDKQRLGLLTYKSGTIVGELLRMFMQFSSTPTSMAYTYLWDLPNSAKAPKGSSMKLNLGKINDVRLKYATNMILAGIITSAIKILIKGEDPTVTGAIFEGVINNGSLVPYHNIITSLVNKELGAVDSTIRSVGKAGYKAFTGADDTAEHVIKAFREITPFTRLWYVKNSVDHIIINQLIEYFNPGYLAKKQRQLERKGISFFQDMDELTPFNRVPNLKLSREVE
ncbi:hypothetical protein lam_683 [Candidatus Liberibacter americanus str. Sao Paulo]|uniref:Uncharacterized protein n=1 Tax=Candidatus Liberibacter americanus str. Sao Paulo TaxID=1261131 RepID=U6B4N3_9HYPH|nr:hypothetical protein [Candidatus Liberibacter americanus]AHA28029.1 hypothetical protein lam_683 [Candidatus Liberibacter americanus str. Sao Paulo]